MMASKRAILSSEQREAYGDDGGNDAEPVAKRRIIIAKDEDEDEAIKTDPSQDFENPDDIIPA